MATIYDKDTQELIEKAAEGLQKEVTLPDWAKLVRTSHAKKRVPLQPNWWQLRAASILRKVYVDGPIGTNKLRTKYGSKKNRGHRPERFKRASGKIIRTILQQLEKAEYIKQDKHGNHKGRVITPKGKSFLDKLSNPKGTNK